MCMCVFCNMSHVAQADFESWSSCLYFWAMELAGMHHHALQEGWLYIYCFGAIPESGYTGLVMGTHLAGEIIACSMHLTRLYV